MPREDSGADLWRVELPGINGWLVPAGRSLLVGGWRGYTPLVAIDVATGTVRWKEQRRPSRLAEPVVGPWGIAVASIDEPIVRFLDPETDATSAERPLPEHDREPDASPLLRRHGDLLLLAGKADRYHQLRSPRGPWTVLFEHLKAIQTDTPPIIGGDVIFTDAGQLNCYDLDAGQRRWSLPWEVVGGTCSQQPRPRTGWSPWQARTVGSPSSMQPTSSSGSGAWRTGSRRTSGGLPTKSSSLERRARCLRCGRGVQESDSLPWSAHSIDPVRRLVAHPARAG